MTRQQVQQLCWAAQHSPHNSCACSPLACVWEGGACLWLQGIPFRCDGQVGCRGAARHSMLEVLLLPSLCELCIAEVWCNWTHEYEPLWRDCCFWRASGELPWGALNLQKCQLRSRCPTVQPHPVASQLSAAQSLIFFFVPVVDNNTQQPGTATHLLPHRQQNSSHSPLQPA